MPEEYDVQQAVDNGFTLLNTHKGTSWIWEISLDRLDIASTFECILGQLTGSYWQAIDDLAAMLGESDVNDIGVYYGFVAPSHNYLARSEELTGEWARRITEARNA